jgi:hypothetical protein
VTKLTSALSTASDLRVQIEKLEGPDDWPKWKWQNLMLLCAHCLEGITDGSRKCPVLPADAQHQQKRNQPSDKMTPKPQALLHAR